MLTARSRPCPDQIASAPPRPPRRTVRIKPASYQPTKAELDEEVQINGTPEALARANVTPVKVVRDSD